MDVGLNKHISYVYIYIERERESERDNSQIATNSISFSLQQGLEFLRLHLPRDRAWSGLSLQSLRSPQRVPVHPYNRRCFFLGGLSQKGQECGVSRPS